MQLSENEIYIGVNENPNYSSIERIPNYSVNGYPSAVLDIDGQGFVAGFIKMMPPIKLSKQFLEDVTQFEINSEQAGDYMEIKGEIVLNQGKLMTVELAKYIFLFMK